MINVAFIKNNIVMDILVFDENQDNQDLINSIKSNNNYEEAININNDIVGLYSTWNGIEFITTELEVLSNLGVINYVEPTETTD